MEATDDAGQSSRYSLTEAAFLVAAVVAFLAFTLPNLGNYPPPTDDEIWILSSADKLANHGVFGTDLFAGFWHAESYYLWNMPLHHIVLAGVFKVFGTSIFAARSVSVLYGAVTILLVYALGRRLGGVWVAALSVVLLLFLRLHIGFEDGLPLQETARSIRYDLAAVPFMVGGCLLLLKPTTVRVALAGATLALGTLMQFFGFFMLPILAVYLLLERAPLKLRLRLIGIAAIASILVAVPYGVYVLSHYDDFQGQTSTLYRRTNLDDPTLYLDNLKREYKRYRLHFESLSTVLHKPSAKVGWLFAFPVSLVYMGWRTRRFNRRADRIVFLSLAGLPLEFTLLDFQKVSYYLIGIFPFLCIAIAMTGWAAIEWLRPYLRRPLGAGPLRLAAAGLTAVLLLGFMADGAWGQFQGLRDSGNATNYMSLRPFFRQYIPAHSKVLGSTQLWWAMPDTDFRSYYMLYYRTNPLTTDRVTNTAGYLDEFGAQYVVLDSVSRLFLRPVNPSLDAYLHAHGERILLTYDKSFRQIEIWKINR
ncbi:MAG TPA: glycosyltransferase family 39 protein [Dehalococcoidia bacterium]|nr:glycosyltransferase family 39 protein [Dehalococcoidia bacterium]